METIIINLDEIEEILKQAGNSLHDLAYRLEELRHIAEGLNDDQR